MHGPDTDETARPADARDARGEQDAARAEEAAADRATRAEADIPHLPLVEEAADARRTGAGEPPRPTWRGWIHTVTAPIALAAGVLLVLLGQDAEARWASAVFALSSLLLFGNSALYHRVDWSPPVKRTLKRIDHANIFLLIAGTYTPMSLLALPPEQGLVLLVAVWAGALLGIGFRVFWISAPRWLYVPIYIGLGWAALAYLPDLFAANAAMMVLILVGGLLYTAGAVVYGLKRPNPFPGRFGFHEIFHTCTVLAFLCHWTATLLVVLDPPA